MLACMIWWMNDMDESCWGGLKSVCVCAVTCVQPRESTENNVAEKVLLDD